MLPSSPSSLTYHFRRIQGLRIFYREGGPSDAPTLVLLHGYPSSSRMYDPLLPFLAPHFHVIAPDYPGFGLSDRPKVDEYPYTFESIADTMSQLLENLGVASYSLFMQDYGGPVGFRMAMSDPSKIRSIIVQNANAYLEGLGKKWENLALYWNDPEGHGEQLDAFTSYEGERRVILATPLILSATTPSAGRMNTGCWSAQGRGRFRVGYFTTTKIT